MATVILKNKICIDEKFISCILKEADLPAGKILLVLNDGPLINNNIGECVPKILYPKFFHETALRLLLHNSFVCGIAISQKVSTWIKEYPACFVWALGHELGHAYICLSNVEIHIHACLIRDNIRKASDDKITKNYELPDEILFDRFGIYIAEHIFSRNKFNEDLKNLLNSGACKGNELRFNNFFSLSGTNNFNNLRTDLINFSLPYKDRLIELWKNDFIINNGNSLVRFISNYDALFE